METDGAGPLAELRERLQSTLRGSYTLQRELGGGGTSRVFVAEDTRFGRRVAVKVLHPDLAAGLSAQRFEREILLAARLQHPHIVPFLSAGEVDGLLGGRTPRSAPAAGNARLLTSPHETVTIGR